MPKLRCSLYLGLFVLLTSSANAQTPRSAQEFFNRGEERFTKGDFEGAIASFTRVIEIDRPRSTGVPRGQNWAPDTPPGNHASTSDQIVFVSRLTAPAYINRGLARAHMGDLEGALADCDTALVINPGLVLAYMNRGALRWTVGDLDGATADFDQAIQRNPRDPQAYTNRGNLRAEKRDYSGALSDLDHAILLDPSRAEFYGDRGVIRIWSGDTRGGFVDLEQGIKINPKSSWVYYCRARGWYSNNDFERSIADLNRAIALDPTFARAFGDRGLNRLRLGQAAEAEKDFAECLRWDPSLKAELDRSIKAVHAVMAKP